MDRTFAFSEAGEEENPGLRGTHRGPLHKAPAKACLQQLFQEDQTEFSPSSIYCDTKSSVLVSYGYVINHPNALRLKIMSLSGSSVSWAVFT